jgi:anti-sigma factor RsiW
VNECMAVREQLTEWAVSTLPEDERREVDRHLEWCAGCRKEATELRGGAALVGLSLPHADPPKELEERVVVVVRSAATKPPPGRRSRRIIRGSVLLAAVLGLLAVAGGLIARQQSTESKLHFSQQQARAFAQRLSNVLQDLQPPTQANDMTRAILGPAAGKTGGGGAIRVVSPHFEDLAVVIVGALPQRDGPYRVWLVTPSGRRLGMGKMRVDSGGGATLAREFSQDLRLYHYVEVQDAKGRLVLSGGFA